MKTKIKVLACLAGLAAGISHSSAAIMAVDLGTAVPPATLGGYAVSAYDPGSIAGGTAATVGSGWATWGQGYTGTVYYTLNGAATLTLSLSAATKAVYFYMEPNQFADFTMTAVSTTEGVSVSTTINGFAGSSGVGFWETGSSELTTISVTANDPTGFAIGEFGISDGGGFTGTIGVPDQSSTLALLAIAMFGFVAARRRT